MRWARRAARVGERKIAYMLMVEKLKGKYKLEDKGKDGEIIYKGAFSKWDEEMRTSLICLLAGCCEYGGEALSSIKCWKFV
jgi:hypothetical protein